MFPNLTSVTSLLALLAVLLASDSEAAHQGRGSLSRRHQLHNRLSYGEISPIVGSNLTKRAAPPTRKRPSCAAKTSSSLVGTTTAATETTMTTASTVKATSTKAATTSKVSNSGNNVAANGGSGKKPANWPSETQAGAAPAATRTSAADPFLLALSKSYNNRNNPLYTQTHVGQMTYYGQGLGACGDTYDDSSYTAAVSKLMYDAWPGAQAGQMNRNPICGPFVPGRKGINLLGLFETVVSGAEFVNIGGDGLLNCDTESQCHIPLTATVTHGDKSIQVKIVDRCEACAIGDIDLTPTAFAAIADMSLGRTSVEWHFNNY